MVFLVMVLLTMLFAAFRFLASLPAFFFVVLAALAMVLLAALPAVLLATTPNAALLATLFAAAECPGGHLDFFDRRHRIVALDHQFTASGFLLRGEVSNRYVQTRPRMQR